MLTLAVILALGICGFLIFFLLMERKTQKNPSLKSQTKIASSFVCGAGAFNIFLAILFSVFKNKSEDIIPPLAKRYLGIYGVIGIFILIGIACIVKGRSLQRKSEQIEKDRH